MKIQHKKSAIADAGVAKRPTAAATEYGELCINYNHEDPSLFIRVNDKGNDTDSIVKVGGDLDLYLLKADLGATVILGETPPVFKPNGDQIAAGDLWYCSSTVAEGGGRLYVYYVDDDTSQWVDTSLPGTGADFGQAEAEGLFLSKVNDDTAAGAITFEGLTTHEAGVKVTGGTIDTTAATGEIAYGTDPESVSNALQFKASDNGQWLRLYEGGLHSAGSLARAGVVYGGLYSSVTYGSNVTQVTCFKDKTNHINVDGTIERVSFHADPQNVSFNAGNTQQLIGFKSEINQATVSGSHLAYNFYAAGDAPNYFNGTTIHDGGVCVRGAITEYRNGLNLQYKGAGVCDIAAWRSGANSNLMTFSTTEGDSDPVERVRINTDGQVKLTGNSGGRLYVDANQVTSGYDSLIQQTNVGLEFTVKSNSRGFVFKTGSTPTPKLEIAGNGNLTASATAYFVGKTTHEGGIQLPNITNAGTLGTDANGNIVVGSGTGAGDLWTQGAGAIYPTTLTNNVGIGTSSPSQSLSVDGPTLSTTFAGALISANATERLRIGYRTGGPDTGLTCGQIVEDTYTLHIAGRDSSPGDIVFHAGSGVPEIMRINASLGNVGIGDVSPSAKLSVNGEARAGRNTGQYISLSGDAGGNTLKGVSSAGNIKPLIIAADSSSSSLQLKTESSNSIEFYTNSLNRMIITADGNVGIGAAPGSYKFYANGTSYFASRTFHNQDISVGHSTAGLLPGFDNTSIGSTLETSPGGVSHFISRNQAPLLYLNVNGTGKFNMLNLRQNGVNIGMLRSDATGTVTEFVGRVVNVRSGPILLDEGADARNIQSTEAITNASAIVQQLQPVKINGTSHGFTAAALQPLVAEAVTGTAGETRLVGTYTDAEGNTAEDVPEPESIPFGETWEETGTEDLFQAVDQTRLIPLLTKALQEALARLDAIESNEVVDDATDTVLLTTVADLVTRVEALEGA